MKRIIFLTVVLFSCTAIKNPSVERVDFDELDYLTSKLIYKYERGEVSKEQINKLINILE